MLVKSHENITFRKLWIFTGITAVGLLASLFFRFQLGFNAGHIDEYDYLFVGKQLLAGHSWNTHTYIFGADFNWYIYGLGESIAGLHGARFIAVLFGLLSLYGCYVFVKHLLNSKEIALLSTALLAFQAVHIFISKFATYDVISFTFMILALGGLMISVENKNTSRYFWLVLGIILFSLSISGKYSAIIYFPIIAFALFLYSPMIAILFSLGVGLILGLYVWIHLEDLTVLYQLQIQGTHGANSTYKDVFSKAMTYVAFPISLWFVAILSRMVKKGNKVAHDDIFWILLGLFVLSLPMIVYHLHGQNMISIYKHMIFPLLFLTPVTAWLLWELMRYFKFGRLSQIVSSTVVIGILAINYQQLKDMENGYPNVTAIHQAVMPNIKQNTTILSEDPYLFRYVAFDQLPQSQIKEMTRVDNNLDGKFENQDIKDAIWDAKFEYIFLNDLVTPDLNKELRGALLEKSYTKILQVPYSTSAVMNWKTQGVLELYQRNVTPRIPMSEDKLFR